MAKKPNPLGLKVPIIGQRDERPVEEHPITLEDLSNAVNGTLGHVAAILRQHNFTPPEIELIINEALENGIEEMRRLQEERKKQQPMVEIVQ